MMKISNEVKVGAVALVTIVVFIWLFNFLKGKDLLNPARSYYVVYDQVGGLTETNPVEINGYKAGVVQSISFIDDLSGRLLVRLTIDKKFTLPVNTVAEITTASLIAGMKIRLVWGDGPGTYQSGDTIPGRMATSILTEVQNKLDPLTGRIENMVGTLDSVLTGINEILDPSFRSDLKNTMSNLQKSSAGFGDMIGDEKSGLRKMTNDLSRFSAALSANSEKLGSTIANLETITDTLAAADLYATVMSLKETLQETSSLLSKMNAGEGTTGQLLTNDSLYVNLNNSIGSLDLLLKDLKANPKRYVHFSLFGKKTE